jgi:hypothetical protein
MLTYTSAASAVGIRKAEWRVKTVRWDFGNIDARVATVKCAFDYHHDVFSVVRRGAPECY